MIVFLADYVFDYYYIFRLHSLLIISVVILLNIFMFILMKYRFTTEVFLLYENREKVTLKSEIKKERKEIKITFRGALIIFITLGINIVVGYGILPKEIVKNIQCYEKNDEVYVVTELDKNLIGDFEIELQSLVDKPTHIIAKNLLSKEYKKYEMPNELLNKAVTSSIKFWILIILLLSMGIIMTEPVLSIYSVMDERQYKNNVFKQTFWIRNIRYRREHQLVALLSKVELKEKKHKLQNNIFLGIVYHYLKDIDGELGRLVFIKNSTCYSIEDYNTIKEINSALVLIKYGKKQLRKLNRPKTRKRKEKILTRVRETIGELDKLIMNNSIISI